METTRQTAGETATIYNCFEEEIFRLNRERDARIASILEDIHRECKQAKARVIEEANAHYEKFPGENWLWKKVYRFFKKNPDVCLQILKEEGGVQ